MDTSSINRRNAKGCSPLHLACEQGDTELICRLLVKGADVTLKNGNHEVPFDTALRLGCDDDVLEVLFDYTVDCLEPSDGRTLLTAVMYKSSWVPRIVDRTTAIDVELCDFSHLNTVIRNRCFGVDHFRLFALKFGYVIKKLLSKFGLFVFLRDYSSSDYLLEYVDALVGTDVFEQFMEMAVRGHDMVAVFGWMVHCRDRPRGAVLNNATQLMCYLLSYGFELDMCYMVVLYKKFGLCDLFRLLLHMDVKEGNFSMVHEVPLPYMFCDMRLNLGDFFKKFSGRLSTSPRVFSRYTARYEYKQYCLKWYGRAKGKRVIKGLPDVPSLLELAREAARDFVVHRCNAKKSSQFYTVLKRLPIPEVCKEIISYEKHLYNV